MSGTRWWPRCRGQRALAFSLSSSAATVCWFPPSGFCHSGLVSGDVRSTHLAAQWVLHLLLALGPRQWALGARFCPLGRFRGLILSAVLAAFGVRCPWSGQRSRRGARWEERPGGRSPGPVVRHEVMVVVSKRGAGQSGNSPERACDCSLSLCRL